VYTPFAPPAAKPLPRPEAKAEPAPPVAGSGAPAPTGGPAAQAAAANVSALESSALLRAFFEGAGIPDASLPNGLTPEAMEKIGKLLRAAVRGTLDLIRARAVTKSELRLELTAITPRENNPLKFSPTPEAALAHLLAPHVPGFMEPLRAMQEAYDDLRAHQLGFLAGMRAALEEVLARFAPEELEKRLPDRSVLDGMLPMNRKAKQWDLFVERYEDIAAQVRDDFNAILGKSFRRAYEAQVKELRSESRQG
jgi:FHA domain-containing protein